MMLTTNPQQLLSDMNAIAVLFKDATRRPLWWSESYHASIATAIHREAWLEEVRRHPRPRTAAFLNEWEFDRLLAGGGREAEVSRANVSAYARHRMEENAPRPRPKKLERWRQHLMLVSQPEEDAPE